MPAREINIEFTPEDYPPFPSGAKFKTVELETLSLKKLTENSEDETNRLVEAFKTRGFVYLELPGTENGDTIANGSSKICRVAEDFFTGMDIDQKRLYVPEHKSLFGYKHRGAGQIDSSGTLDTAEFFNVSKNDMIVPDAQMKRNWPPCVMEEKRLLADYCKAAHATGMQLMCMVTDKLGIDRDEILSRHRIEDQAGDHIRMTRGPPRETPHMPEIAVPSHTDFGTITILMNWLGGLQVWSVSSRRPGVHEPDVPGEWLWVKTKKDCAIVNLGDAAVKFTNGVLCSGRHRVVPAPGEQGLKPRYSLVYFVRPSDHSRLKVLPGHAIPPAEDPDEEGIEAKEWIVRQTLAIGVKFAEN